MDIILTDHHSKVGPHIGSTDILVTFGPMLTDEVLRQATNLKWIQALGTGVDNIVDLPSLRPEVIVTNIRGIHGPAMSEAAITAMLALSCDLARVIRNQERQIWQRWPARLLHQKVVGILGIGAIAEALAPRCKAMGMTVVGISSSKREVPGFDRVHGRDELVSAVSNLDYFVVLAPYSAATRHLVDAAVLSAMKPSCYLVNLARGGVIDEPALIQALEKSRIAGAALDVFAQGPLPQGHPFWSMKNVIVTPHLGGVCDVYPDLSLPVVEKNIFRFLAGDTANMINIVAR